MKRILILASKRSGKKEEFITYLQKYFGGEVEAVLGVFSDLVFQIETGNIVVEIGGRNINDFDLVYFRNTLGFQSMASGLSIYLESTGVKFFDKSFINGSFVGDKFTSSMRLAVQGLPIVPTLVCWNGAIDKTKELIIRKYGFPVVAKEVRSQRMQRVYLLNSAADFDKLPKTVNSGSTARYLFQKFIHIDREFRFLVLGNKVGIIHTKTLRDNTGFKIGYKNEDEYPEFLDPNEVSETLKQTAVKAANVLHVEIAGVDMCRERTTGKIYVFEVNRGPGVDYDTDVSQELPEMAKFFSNELGIKKS